MKILAIYDSITGLFPRKISVTLVHALNGNVIGDYKMSMEQLPEVFNKPTILDLGECSWRVTTATPFQLNNVARHRKLVLHVVEVTSSFEGFDNHFMVPTKASPSPILTKDAYCKDFTIQISLENWRQLEFFSTSQLLVVQEEITFIENIICAVKDEEGLLGYNAIYERTKTADTFLNIPFDDFYKSVNGIEKGTVQLNTSENIRDSFTISSKNYNYYGIMKDNSILNLCLQQFDCADDEFAEIVNKYDLLLADWCNGELIF